ncbi:hypothetical protein VB780_05325 [Leptolyngbya sp. CCNP1308]|uniref:hypothetical protein n=1 Tax=Leptolyngbya sp. CCNP1308 TaxID=3110255 RepID=UPI002B21B1B4|nr:hypothetical protein [Leptolyngbya sp. CCNP1308]MEA5447980.1 hypothetical protein [Leptolyngbya sp. CCNP1308]
MVFRFALLALAVLFILAAKGDRDEFPGRRQGGGGHGVRAGLIIALDLGTSMAIAPPCLGQPHLTGNQEVIAHVIEN